MKRWVLPLLFMTLCFGAEGSTAAVPKRIVSLSVVTDEILLSLASRERVVGVSRYANDPLKCYVFSLAKGIPRLRRDDVESILGLSPDLVLLSTRAAKELEALLKQAGVSVTRVPTPLGLEDIRRSIRVVARAIGKTMKAESLIRKMNRKLQNLEGLPSSGLSALFYTPGGWTSGKNTSVGVIIKYAGLENAASEIEGHRVVQLEWVLKVDPDLILVSEGYLEFEGWLKRLRTDPRYSSLTAVRTRRVIGIPARNLYTISHFIADAAADLRERLIQRAILAE